MSTTDITGPALKAFTLEPSSCGNISSASANAFHQAYQRGWSGKTGKSAIAAFRDGGLARYASYYYKVDPTRTSSSGWGSNLGPTTQASVAFLRSAILKHDIRSMIDVPCGDVNWQFGAFEIDALDAYVGLDITSRLVRLNSGRFAFHSNKIFAEWDMASCAMPKLRFTGGAGAGGTGSSAGSDAMPADMIHMRYVLQHLALDRALAAIAHAVASGAKFLVATTYPKGGGSGHNSNIQLGQGSESHFYLNDLNQPPFSLPPPLDCLPSPKSIGNDSTCLYDLRDKPAMAKWLDRAQRTRIVGTRRTTRLVVRGEPQVLWLRSNSLRARSGPEEAD